MAHATHPVHSSVRVWDLPVRLFHWSLVAAIALAFVSSEEGSPLSAWHMAAGWIAAVLIVFRMCWGIIGNAQARFANFVKPCAVISHVRELLSGKPQRSLGHNPLGGLAVLALLAGTTAVAWTGVQMTSGTGNEELHEILAFALLGLIAVHVIGVVVMSVMTSDNLVMAMLTGRKVVHGMTVAPEGRASRIMANLSAVAIVALSVLGVTRYDRDAFSLRPSEEAENAEHDGQHRLLAAGHAEGDNDDD